MMRGFLSFSVFLALFYAVAVSQSVTFALIYAVGALLYLGTAMPKRRTNRREAHGRRGS